MAHVEHFKQGDVARMTHEWERDVKKDEHGKQLLDEDGNPVWAFTPTGNIDPSRTHLNYTIADGRADANLRARLSDEGLKVDKRKHVNKASVWEITCPEELRNDPEKVKRFFEVSYAFLQDRYKPENVLQGYVHMDETSPHMHAAIVPVKDGRVSAKAVFTRQELRDFHTDLDAVMEKEFHIKGLVKNGRTKGGYTTAELKERTRAEQAAKNRETRLDKRSGELFDKQDELNQREEKLEKQEAALEVERAAVTKRSHGVDTREAAVAAREAAVEAREAILRDRVDQIATEATEAAKIAYTAAQAQKLKDEQAEEAAKKAAAKSISDAIGAYQAVRGTGYQSSGRAFPSL